LASCVDVGSSASFAEEIQQNVATVIANISRYLFTVIYLDLAIAVLRKR